MPIVGIMTPTLILASLALPTSSFKVCSVVYADLIGSLFFKSKLECSYTLDLSLSVTSLGKPFLITPK